MKPDQSLDTDSAVAKYVIPGYNNGIGKPSIVAQLIRVGFDREYAVELVDRYEPDQSLDTDSAVAKYVVPGYDNGIGKPTIVAQLIRAGFDREYAVELVDRYEPAPGSVPWPAKPTRVDCPYCGAKNIYVTQRSDFAFGWFLLSPFLYLLYHFVFKPSGGSCSNCLEKLPREFR